MNNKKLTLLLMVIGFLIFTVIIIYIYLNLQKTSEFESTIGTIQITSVKQNQCDLTKLKERELLGIWSFSGWENVDPAEFVLNKDNTFLFKGYKDIEFKSSGIWKYNTELNTIKFSFNDKAEFWSLRLNQNNLKEYQKSSQDIYDMGSVPVPYLEVKIKSSLSYNSTCNYHLNFLGWIFNHQVKK